MTSASSADTATSPPTMCTASPCGGDGRVVVAATGEVGDVFRDVVDAAAAGVDSVQSHVGGAAVPSSAGVYSLTVVSLDCQIANRSGVELLPEDAMQTRDDSPQPTFSGPFIQRVDFEPPVCRPPCPTCGAPRPVLMGAAVPATGPPSLAVPDLSMLALP